MRYILTEKEMEDIRQASTDSDDIKALRDLDIMLKFDRLERKYNPQKESAKLSLARNKRANRLEALVEQCEKEHKC